MQPNRIIIFFIVLILSASNCFGQNLQTTDSVKSIIDRSIENYDRRLDSIDKAHYIKMLETSQKLETTKTDYHSLSISILSFLVTVLAIIIGVNWFTSAQQHKKDLEAQRNEYTKSLEAQKELFEDSYKKQHETFSETVATQTTEFNLIQSNFESVLNNLIKQVEDKIASLPKQDANTDDLKKELQNLKSLFNQRNSFDVEFFRPAQKRVKTYVTCKFCNHEYSPEVTTEGVKKHAITTCPACRKINVTPLY